MEFLVKTCLTNEDSVMAAVIKRAEYFGDNFQYDGSHDFSPEI